MPGFRLVKTSGPCVPPRMEAGRCELQVQEGIVTSPNIASPQPFPRIDPSVDSARTRASCVRTRTCFLCQSRSCAFFIPRACERMRARVRQVGPVIKSHRSRSGALLSLPAQNRQSYLLKHMCGGAAPTLAPSPMRNEANDPLRGDAPRSGSMRSACRRRPSRPSSATSRRARRFSAPSRRDPPTRHMNPRDHAHTRARRPARRAAPHRNARMRTCFVMGGRDCDAPSAQVRAYTQHARGACVRACVRACVLRAG
jgi:hypothetical protein